MSKSELSVQNPVDHDQAFEVSKSNELTYGTDRMPNIYAAYLDLRAKNLELERQLEETQSDNKKLHEALMKASEHLKFCEYGDFYERGFAREQGLEKIIQDALTGR